MTKVTDLIERLKDDSSDFVYHERHEAAAELLRLSSECEALHDWLLETQMLAYKWMEAHDKLHSGKPYTFPKPADLPEALTECEALRALVEQAFREGFSLGDFAGGGQAAPRTADRAWENSHVRTTLQETNGGGDVG